MNHKDVEVQGRRYRVGRLDATDGSWIAIMVTNKVNEERQQRFAANPESAMADMVAAQAVEISADQAHMQTAIFLTGKLTRAELREVQEMVVETCSRIERIAEQDTVQPLKMSDGRWAFPELRTDAVTLLALTNESLAFNIAPFFPGAGSSPQTEPKPATPISL